MNIVLIDSLVVLGASASAAPNTPRRFEWAALFTTYQMKKKR
jgi:hypothetical protein